MNASEAAIQIYKAALESVQPARLHATIFSLQGLQIILGDQVFPLSQFTNIYVIGAGKATATMALASEEILGSRISVGIIAVKKDHGLPLKYIQQIEAGHPVPDEGSAAAAAAIVELLHKLTKDDLLIVLTSGGGSSLLTDLPGEISFKSFGKSTGCCNNAG